MLIQLYNTNYKKIDIARNNKNDFSKPFFGQSIKDTIDFNDKSESPKPLDKTLNFIKEKLKRKKLIKQITTTYPYIKKKNLADVSTEKIPEMITFFEQYPRIRKEIENMYTEKSSECKSCIEALSYCFSSLFKYEFEQAKELFSIKENNKSCKLGIYDIYVIAQLPLVEFKQAKELAFIKERQEDQLNSKDVYKLAHLSPEHFKQAKELLHITERKSREFGVLGCEELIQEEKTNNDFVLFPNYCNINLRKYDATDDISYCSAIFIFSQLPSNKFKEAKEEFYKKERGKNQLKGIELFNILQLGNEKIQKDLNVILHKAPKERIRAFFGYILPSGKTVGGVIENCKECNEDDRNIILMIKERLFKDSAEYRKLQLAVHPDMYSDSNSMVIKDANELSAFVNNLKNF